MLSPHSAPLRWLRRAFADKGDLRRVRPDMVVADGDQACLLAARTLGIPSIALGHDLLFTQCALPSGLPFASLAHQTVNAVVPSTMADQRVVVHFLPAVARYRENGSVFCPSTAQYSSIIFAAALG